jgi:hypothetical protein
MITPSGYILNIIPPFMIYLPVNRRVISAINFKITDEDDKLLDFRNQEMCLAVHIRSI